MHRKDGLHLYRKGNSIVIEIREDGSQNARVKGAATLTDAEWSAIVEDIGSREASAKPAL